MSFRKHMLVLGSLLLVTAGCAAGTHLVSPDGQKRVVCGPSQTLDEIYLDVHTLGIARAQRRKHCVEQFQSVGFLSLEAWQARETEARQLWQEPLRPQVVSGTLTVEAAVTQLNTRERALFGDSGWRGRLHALRQLLADAVDRQELSLTQAELVEAEFRDTGRLPQVLHSCSKPVQQMPPRTTRV